MMRQLILDGRDAEHPPLGPPRPITDELLDLAVDAYHDEYLRMFPQGGDAEDHDAAVREGVYAAITVALASFAKEPRA